MLLPIVALALAAGCADPYVIGEEGLPPAGYCPAGVVCTGRLEASYAQAGTGAWGDRFVAGRISRAPALLLRGEDATASGWTARTGGALSPVDVVQVGARGPFTDATRAARGRFASAAPIVELGPQDLAIELVLRARANARVLDAPTAGLAIASDDTGALTLAIGASAIATAPLVDGAWYHVLFVVRASGSRVYVNGAAMDGPGAVIARRASHAIAVDGEVAWLAIVPLGDGELQVREARERFARLVGVAATLAGGDPIPTTIARDGAAFTDLVEDGARALHLVGPDWPRIACRPAPSGATACGYLAEGGAGRGVPLDLQQWTVTGAITAAAMPLADDVPTVTLADPATLARTVDGGGDRVVSLFARGAGEVTIDLAQVGSVRCAPGAATATIVTSAVPITAAIEPWGAGWVRCALVTEAAPGGPLALTLAGSAIDLAGPQAEGNRITPTSLALAARGDDVLVYDTVDNIPAADAGAVRARVLAAGASIHDRSVIGLAARDATGPVGDDSAAIYLQTRQGAAHFAAFAGGAIAWNAGTAAALVDTEAAIRATWSATAATLSDGAEQVDATAGRAIQGATFAEVRVGGSARSGTLDGLVRDFAIGPP
ncbi:MAG: LamG domain-containing protein [Deltaproteobacteria bacterium]|nr:LamG domain-containing protein [Deltaproteobacteria bacterium]